MAQHEIRIEKHSYLPRRQAIAKGDTVVWLNNDPVAHTVTAADGSFDSGQLESKQTFSHTFEKAGTIGYHCDNHEKMKGTVAVDQKGQMHEIRIEKHSYLPSEQSVAKGDTVEWFNNDPDAHTVTADDGSFDSGQLESQQTFSHTFDGAGTVSYHCDNHANMKGTITVEQKVQTHTIEITQIAYPADTPVAKGDTVEWINQMGMEHTVTADNGEFDGGPFGTDEKFSRLFDTAGTFPYHCEIHFRMRGKVTVT